MNLNWLINRLKTLSFLELVFRIYQFLGRKNEKLFLNRNQKSIKHIHFSGVLDIPRIEKLNLPKDLLVFGKNLSIEETIPWHYDLYSNNSFDKKFCFSMSPRTHGNKCVKHTWEINRFHFLVSWAVNYIATGSEKYLNLIKSSISSWIVENPYLIGVNWYSGLEVSVRLLNWWLTIEILNSTDLKHDKYFQQFLTGRWNHSIYHHIKFIRKHLSFYSSANNHLIGELASLYIACSVWDFNKSDRWKKKSKHLLEREILKQHNHGINKEESFEYIQFIADFLTISFWVGEKTNNLFSKSYKDELKNIYDYIYDATDSDGEPYNYGDEDDGFLFKPELKHYNNFKCIIASGVILFNDKAYKQKTTEFGIKNLLIFGRDAEIKYNSSQLEKSEGRSAFFQKQGHFYFKNNDNKIYAHFNVAPLGYLSTAVHGHADALSFVLKVKNQWFLVDPGTYVYHKEPDFRQYFKGTVAHNTIRIDNCDQALSKAPMIWLKHYKSNVQNTSITDELEEVTGEHNGYEAIGTNHRRKVQYRKKENLFLIIDSLSNLNGVIHKAEIIYHIHPDIEIKQTGLNIYELKNQNSSTTVTLNLPNDFQYSVLKGQNNPVIGWYSKGYYQIEPSSVIIGVKNFEDSFECITKIKVETL